MNWFADMSGDLTTVIIVVIAALVLLVAVVLGVRFIRGMTSGTFVAGGRNRKTRLAVMDATAVDSHRRLVLVRRDNVEHLLLIGGPTDVVVEREIKVATNGRKTQSVFDEDDFDAEALALPPQQPVHQPPRQRAPDPAQRPQPPMRPAAPQPIAPAAASQQAPARAQPSAPQPARGVAPPRQTGARPPARDLAPPPARTPSRMPPAAPLSRNSTGVNPYSQSSNNYQQSNNLDDALLRELEVTFEPPAPKSTPKPVEMTLDDEMTKLLGELSNGNSKR